MGIALIDSNIFIDHFEGVPAALNEISYYGNLAMSAVTWMEVSVMLDAAQMAEFEAMIRDLPIYVLHTDEAIMREATRLRAESLSKNKSGVHGVKKLLLPDAIILATAHVTGRTLVSRDADDFLGAAQVQVRLPYKYSNGIVSEIAMPIP